MATRPGASFGIEQTATIDQRLLLEVLEVLRLAPIYVLKDANLPLLLEAIPDFQRHKWDGSEPEFAEKASDCYRRLLDAMTKSRPEAGS